jgi:hypothetical protein
MSGFCDRCNEKSSRLINISSRVPETATIAHHGYRQICEACYDDLMVEAGEQEESNEDRRTEPRIRVSIRAQVEGNTSHLEPFSELMTIEEISPSGLRLHTARELDPGTVLKLRVPEYGIESTALVEAVWCDRGQHSVGLKLIERSEEWNKLWRDYSE